MKPTDPHIPHYLERIPDTADYKVLEGHPFGPFCAKVQAALEASRPGEDWTVDSVDPCLVLGNVFSPSTDYLLADLYVRHTSIRPRMRCRVMVHLDDVARPPASVIEYCSRTCWENTAKLKEKWAGVEGFAA